jgi:hypothetical protein
MIKQLPSLHCSKLQKTLGALPGNRPVVSVHFLNSLFL